MLKAIKIDPETNEIGYVTIQASKWQDIAVAARNHLGAERLAKAWWTKYGDVIVVDRDRPMGDAHIYLKDVGMMIAGPALVFGRDMGPVHHEPVIPIDEVPDQIEMIDAVSASDWIRTWTRERRAADFPEFYIGEILEGPSTPRFFSASPRRAMEQVYA